MKTKLVLKVIFLIIFWTIATKGIPQCDTPGGLAVGQVSESTATITWSGVPGANQYRINVEDANQNPIRFEIEVVVSGLQYIVSGLEAGSSYKTKVRSICPDDHSDWSDRVFFSTSGGDGGSGGGGTGGNCAVPGGLAVSGITGTSAILSWEGVAGATGYEVEVEDDENTPLFNQEITTSETSTTATGLVSGGHYKFKVKSLCGNNSSDHAAWVFFSTSGGDGGSGGGGTGGSCAVPGGLAVSGITGTSAILSWEGVAGATGYEVEVEDDESTPLFNQEITTSETITTATGLVSGGHYKFKVKSLCGNNSSDHAAWVFFSTSGGDGGSGGGGTEGSCAVPGGLAVSGITGTSAILSWEGVAGATGYEVEVEDDENTPLFNQEITTSETSTTITGLVSGGQYKFKVKSLCGNNSSDHASWVFFSTSGGDGGSGGGGTGGSCAVPGGLAVSGITGTSAILSWEGVAGATGYKVEVEDDENTPLFNQEITTSETSTTITGLVSGGQYKFKVKSLCGNNSSDHASWVFFSTSGGDGGSGGGGTGGSCAVPGGLAVSGITGTSAILSWEGVAGATGYEVEVEDDENTPLFNQEITTSETSTTITGLVSGGQYKFKVKSLCGNNSSDHASWVFFSTSGGDGGSGGGGTGGSCAVPDGLAVSGITGTSAILSWEGVAGATGYEVEVEDDENTPLFNQEITTSETSTTITGLVSGGQYKFKVKSLCGNNSSDHASWVFFSTSGGDGGSGGGGTGGSCAVPGGLAVSGITGTSAILSWEGVAGATGYEVEVEDDENTPLFNQEFMTGETSIMVSGLVAGGHYKFKVKILCGGNSSDHAAWVFFQTTNKASRFTLGSRAITRGFIPESGRSGIETKIYPNPASSFLVLSVTNSNTTNVQIEITDFSGQVIWVHQWDFSNQGTLTIPVSNFKAGYYQLRVFTKDSYQISRFFVSK